MSHDPLTVQNLFIGLVPGPRVQAALQRHRALWRWTGRELLPDHRLLHLKLFALPGLPAQSVPALRRALRKVPLQPLELVLRHTAILAGDGSTRATDQAVILADRNQALETLRCDIGAVLAGVGYEVPQPPAPHVALALDAPAARPPPATHPIRWRADECALIWARAVPDSPYAWHDVLESWGPAPTAVPAPPVQIPLFG